MRIVALEEHIALAEFSAEVQTHPPRPGSGRGYVQTELEDYDDLRLASMDAAGISVAVLSVPGPGPIALAPDAAPKFARRYNDALAAIVRERPERFASFAHLPMGQPEAAADELERAVTQLGFCGALMSGTTKGKFLDDPIFDPLLARAAKLDVPIYIHPGVPPETVRKAYYDGLGERASAVLSTAGWGWHIETGLHVLRLVLSGAFDRHPNLKIIVGHMGECLPFMLARFDDFLNPTVTALPRTVSQTILDHVTITTAGFFTQPPFLAALLTFGPERILFSVDYPFSKNDVGRKFLDEMPLSPADKEKIAHGNADRLLKLA
jgi:uncharacterized protein